VRGTSWRRYAAPAAFLLAVTLAVLLIRSGLHAGDSSTTTAAVVPTTPTKTVSQTTTTTKRRPPRRTTTSRSAASFYTVQAGDTFEVISSKTGVSVSDLQRLNPNVSSTSLFIGQKIRIK
jgi:LysM repeat protein